MDEFMHVAEIALPLLLQGLGTTAAISVLSILIAMVLGSAVGYMCPVSYTHLTLPTNSRV